MINIKVVWMGCSLLVSLGVGVGEGLLFLDLLVDAILRPDIEPVNTTIKSHD